MLPLGRIELSREEDSKTALCCRGVSKWGEPSSPVASAGLLQDTNTS